MSFIASWRADHKCQEKSSGKYRGVAEMAGPVNFGGRNQLSHLPVGWHLIPCECFDGVVFRKANEEPRTSIGHRTVCKVRVFSPFLFNALWTSNYVVSVVCILQGACKRSCIHFIVNLNCFCSLVLRSRYTGMRASWWSKPWRNTRLQQSHIGEEGNQVPATPPSEGEQAPISNQRALNRRRRNE